MVRVKLLLTATLALLVSVPWALSAAAEDGDCQYQLAIAGLCPAANGAINNGGVDLSAGYETDGGQAPGGQEADGGSGSGGGGGDGTGSGGGVPGAAPVADPLTVVRDDFTVGCIPGSPCDPNLIVRVSDLVNFQPTAPTQAMQPRGWSVVGLPANFIAAASVHTLSGTLLGFPAEVRFTPIGYRWSYGDGAEARTTVGGATWAALGLPEFSDTATSHVFSRAGVYSVQVSAVYSAEFRFAGPSWRAVQGTLPVSAGPLGVSVGDARTVLVNRTCTTNPAGPGC